MSNAVPIVSKRNHLSTTLSWAFRPRDAISFFIHLLDPKDYVAYKTSKMFDFVKPTAKRKRAGF